MHSQIPFVTGGAEVLVNGLVAALRSRGHTAEMVALPLQWNPPGKLLGTALAWRMLDLTSVAGELVDIVICTKFPTWAVRHPNKVLWLIHQHRQAYDLFGTKYSEFGPHDKDQNLRSSIFQIDRIGILECTRRYSISKNVSERLSTFVGVDSKPLYPPVEDRELWPEEFEPYVLSVARLDDLKRIDALVDAWSHVDPGLNLKITSTGPWKDELERRVRDRDLLDRIEFLGRVDDDELARLYRNCRAVYYAPIDEDYGYAAVEAMTAGKPVITAIDSGGVLEFVRHDESGLITSLEPIPLANAISQYVSVDLAREHGRCGRSIVADINWDHVVSSLLGSGI